MFNYVHLVENRKGFGSMSKEKIREPKTGEENKLEHVDVLIFLVMIHIDLYFSDIFSQKLDFLRSNLGF